jgi:acyl dehydratase
MTTTSMAELPSLKGQELGSSPWFEVTQDRVNTFAEATDDRQWIHLDVERAKRESPFGGPVAHGYLTLSLLIPLWSHVLTVVDAAAVVNYGLNKVRFPAPVPVGGRIRLTATLTDVGKSPAVCRSRRAPSSSSKAALSPPAWRSPSSASKPRRSRSCPAGAVAAPQARSAATCP